MLHFQTKKLSYLIILGLLLVTFLSLNIQVQAENTDKRNKAQALWEQGKNAFNERNYPTALEKFKNSLVLYREIGDKQSEAVVLKWIGKTQYDLKNYTEAEYYYQKALIIYRNLDNKLTF